MSHRGELLTHYSFLYETPHYLCKLQTAVLSRQHQDRITTQTLGTASFQGTRNQAWVDRTRYNCMYFHVCRVARKHGRESGDMLTIQLHCKCTTADWRWHSQCCFLYNKWNNMSLATCTCVHKSLYCIRVATSSICLWLVMLFRTVGLEQEPLFLPHAVFFFPHSFLLTYSKLWLTLSCQMHSFPSCLRLFPGICASVLGQMGVTYCIISTQRALGTL